MGAGVVSRSLTAFPMVAEQRQHRARTVLPSFDGAGWLFHRCRHPRRCAGFGFRAWGQTELNFAEPAFGGQAAQLDRDWVATQLPLAAWHHQAICLDLLKRLIEYVLDAAVAGNDPQVAFVDPRVIVGPHPLPRLQPLPGRAYRVRRAPTALRKMLRRLWASVVCS